MSKKGHYSKHPCVYTDNYGIPHLIIFRNFFVESDLLKYKKMDSNEKKDYDSIVDASNGIALSMDGMDDSKVANSDNFLVPIWRRNGYSNPRDYERSMEESNKENHDKKKSFLSKLCEICKIGKKDADVAFKDIKESLRIPNTPDMKESLKTVESLHKMLKESGQYVQAEKVENYARILTFELNLMNNGYLKYLTEKDIIDFMLKYTRGVSITFLRYFSDILPIDISKKKMEVDKLKIFDNYAVLYYDPNQEVFTWHEEEEQRRLARDPILFGMIDGSDKLYYICDWVYKDDDITMEKVEAIIGRQAKFLKDAEIADTNLFISNTIKHLNEWVDSIEHS